MTRPIMKAKDALHGTEASAYVIIDGNRYFLFQLINFKGELNKDKTTIPLLGSRIKGNRSNNSTGTWTASIYYTTSIFRQMMYEYVKNHKDIYFDIQTTNEDVNSEAGRQTIIYKDCNINGSVLSMIDINAETLNEEISGTFENFEMPEKFADLEGMLNG